MSNDVSSFVAEWLKATELKTYDQQILAALSESVRNGVLDEEALFRRLVELGAKWTEGGASASN